MFFGIDLHPVFQLLFGFKKARKGGYDAVFIKVSEGKHYIPKGLRLFVRRARKAKFPVIGYYHFLTNQDGDAQAENFVKRVNKLGGPKNRVLIVDFEDYGKRTASNEDLKRFVTGVKTRFPGKKILLYSGYGFWNGGDPSGDANDYKVDALWEARYADFVKRDNPKRYWNTLKGWWLSQPAFGGKRKPKRIAGQFTSTGKVGGLYVDVDVFFITLDEMKEFAR